MLQLTACSVIRAAEWPYTVVAHNDNQHDHWQVFSQCMVRTAHMHHSNVV
jgi:hypothetical protein